MSAEQAIREGQIWASKDGKRTVRITHYHAAWDDCRWVNVQTGRRGAIYGCYLRSRYDLTTPLQPAP